MRGTTAVDQTANLSLGQLAERLQATFEGDPATRITGFATLNSARPTDASFVANEKMVRVAAQSAAAVLVIPQGMALADRPVIRVPEIWQAVCRLMEIFHPEPPVAEEIHPTAVVGEGAVLGEGVALGANVVIGRRTRLGARVQVGPGTTIGDDVVVGDDCLFHANVTILRNVTIGSRVILHPGAVIGADGFKFEFIDGAWMKIPQVGTVVIEDDVEIGANSTVDRAFLDETRVGRGTKVDNLVQIAHNVQVGANCLMCAYVGISGSVRIGENCVLAGKVGVKDGVTIGKGVQAAATAAIKDDIPDGEIIIGQPAIPIGEWSRMYAASRKGPEILKRLKVVESKIEKLTRIDD